MKRARKILLGALALTAATQCVSYSEGIEVDLAYQAPPMVSAIQTDRGYRVRLKRAMITFGEVELVFCDGEGERTDRLLGSSRARALSDLGSSRARAHSETTPTQLGVPVIVDLMEGSGIPLFAGTLKPPPGRYCAVRVTCTPADEDALGAGLQRESMLGATVFLEGLVESADGEAIGPVGVRATEPIERELPFAQPLVLTGQEPTVALSVRLNTLEWFDDIEFSPKPMAALEERFLENIGASLEAGP